jgi:hypothetical protein
MNDLFLELFNRVLWKMFMPRTIERRPQWSMLKEKIRNTFRTAEKSKILNILQVYSHYTHLVVAYWYIIVSENTMYHSICSIS